MNFSGAHVAAIEEALERERPGGWRRAAVSDVPLSRRNGLQAGWLLKIPPGRVLCSCVDHVIVALDLSFPASQPRVLAPQADREYSWPHVELGGLLCLPATRIDAGAGDRVLQHLASAWDLLNWDEAKRRSEFEREFAAYWRHRASAKEPFVVSLVAPLGPSREIVYYRDARQIILGDGPDPLLSWLRNTGRNAKKTEIIPTWLTWLDSPPIPSEFPEIGEQVLAAVPMDVRNRILHLGSQLPILIGSTTETGPVLGAVLLECAPQKVIQKGFRTVARVPQNLIEASFAAWPLKRLVVNRADGPWVHGRDHNESFQTLAGKSVGVIGCGALGSGIARLLAEAGVGNFRLIDDESLSPANTARHVLGNPYVGRNKAVGMAQMLRSDFPHIRSVDSLPKQFEHLTPNELAALALCDVVVSAGLGFSTDARLDSWRRDREKPPAHVCTWVEEFAIVGHAVAILGTESLLDGFDEAGRPRFRLTEWPLESAAVVVEAGCGNVFQPHGAVDLQPTVAAASALTLDILVGRTSRSMRRVWQGSRNEVLGKGGQPLPAFKKSFVVKDLPWHFD